MKGYIRRNTQALACVERRDMNELEELAHFVSHEAGFNISIYSATDLLLVHLEGVAVLHI